MKKTIFLKTFWSNLAVIATVLIFSLLIAGRVFEAWYQNYLTQEMGKIVSLSRPIILGVIRAPEALHRELRQLSKDTGTRFTVIDTEGRVLGDSQKEADEMENHRDRPEIAAALTGEVGSNLRFSSTEMARMFYLAVPLQMNDEVIGVLRVSVYARDIDTLIARFRHHLQLGSLLLLLLALIITYFASRSVSKPIRALSHAAREISNGNYDAHVSTRDKGEVGELASAFNDMARRQKNLVSSLSRRQTELRAIMEAMTEGLLVIAKDGNVLLSNQAARTIFPELKIENRKYWETCRNTDIYRQVQDGFVSEGLLSRETSISEQIFRVNSIPIDGEDRLVMTFHNITEFRRLERIKKDFIANLSHEIKTPLTTIHGFVETLEEDLEGEALRQLGIIKRNSERLTSLVKDLLLLSRLEEGGSLHRRDVVNLNTLLKSLIPVYEPLAEKKGLALLSTLPAQDTLIVGDGDRLEDMLVNLLDNAIKYTESGTISLRLSQELNFAVLEIHDSGIGIAAEHLQRIFERFYVVDASRSKQSGGTGLGLSIVKHIVALHEGSLTVESQVQKGTRFTVRLPRKNHADETLPNPDASGKV